jgi:hypothetical protein
MASIFESVCYFTKLQQVCIPVNLSRKENGKKGADFFGRSWKGLDFNQWKRNEAKILEDAKNANALALITGKCSSGVSIYVLDIDTTSTN